jgi:hypothetical protein
MFRTTLVIARESHSRAVNGSRRCRTELLGIVGGPWVDVCPTHQATYRTLLLTAPSAAHSNDWRHHYVLVHAFLTSCLDYCNSIISVVSGSCSQCSIQLQLRFVVQKRKYKHITATLRDDMHWLQSYRSAHQLQDLSHRLPVSASVGTGISRPALLSKSPHHLRSAAHGELDVLRKVTKLVIRIVLQSSDPLSGI